MIHPSGTFEYEAEFTSDSFRDSDIVLQGAATDTEFDRLIDHRPTIDSDDRVIPLYFIESHHGTGEAY